VLPTQIEVRPWRTGDERLILAACFSPASLTSRFMVGTQAIPAAYLRHVRTVSRDRWDAQVATYRGRLLGWSEFGRYLDCADEADMAVMVVDAWHRRGVATALIRAMLPRAAAAGVRVLHADVALENGPARAAATSLFGRPSYLDGLLHFRLALERIVPLRRSADAEWDSWCLGLTG
jgi:GNAT superfamily N-acetyltransferase